MRRFPPRRHRPPAAYPDPRDTRRPQGHRRPRDPGGRPGRRDHGTACPDGRQPAAPHSLHRKRTRSALMSLPVGLGVSVRKQADRSRYQAPDGIFINLMRLPNGEFRMIAFRRPVRLRHGLRQRVGSRPGRRDQLHRGPGLLPALQRAHRRDRQRSVLRGSEHELPARVPVRPGQARRQYPERRLQLGRLPGQRGGSALAHTRVIAAGAGWGARRDRGYPSGQSPSGGAEGSLVWWHAYSSRARATGSG